MAYPSGTLVADVVIRTLEADRRNRYYFISDTPPTTLTELEDCLNMIHNAYMAVYTPLMPGTHRFQRVEGRYWGGGGSDFEANSTSAPEDGDITTVLPGSESDDGTLPDVLPDECSLVIQVRTGQAGRQKRGRRFITGLSERVQYGGRVDGEYKTACIALANKLSDDIAVTTMGFTTTLHARHYNRKDNTLMPISKCYCLETIGTRLDRRDPLSMRERL